MTLILRILDRHRLLLILALGSLASTIVVGCSDLPHSDGNLAVRSMPVVAGRPARVFIFAGLGDNCEPIAAPQITITEPPAKGDVSFAPGQETTIRYSAKGTCAGRKATGTGVYYTARAGQEGIDHFAVVAKLSNGGSATRTFEVTIAKKLHFLDAKILSVSAEKFHR